MIHYLIRLITQKLNQKGEMTMTDQKSTQRVQQSELLDLLENTGVLQEANRTFFHPLGLNLKLEKNLEITLETTEDENGFILHTIDDFKRKTFNDYRTKKHVNRQTSAGFLIQTRDMIRSNKITKNLKLTPPETLKLNTLLTCIDEATYHVKKRLMEKSSTLDKEIFDINFKHMDITIRKDIVDNNYVDVAAKAMMLMYKDHINNELIKIKEIKEKQDETFKEESKTIFKRGDE